ncbi:putative reverse transcriptase domain-containing protein [Tanacetum coccineum]
MGSWRLLLWARFGGGWTLGGYWQGVRKEMSKYLGDFQFGVGVPSGAEAVLHGANRFLNKFHSDGSLAMLTVDFSNAFNLVDRTTLLHEVRTRCPSISLWVDFLYGQSARLYVGDDHIGPHDWLGGPLGPLLFALVLHPLVHRIRDCCQLLFHAWYLDDGTIIGDTKEVKRDCFPADMGEDDHILQGCGIDGADSDYGYALDRVRMDRANLCRLGSTELSLSTAMIHLFPVDEPCPVSRKHDLVGMCLYDVLNRAANFHSRKEAPGELSDRFHRGVSPLVGLRDNGFVAGQAALKKRIRAKSCKLEKACLEK